MFAVLKEVGITGKVVGDDLYIVIFTHAGAPGSRVSSSSQSSAWDNGHSQYCKTNTNL